MKPCLLVLIVLFCAGCGKCGEPQNPVSEAYPCGTRAHMCGSGGCCWNSQDCGGDTPGCPDGYCCASGMSASRKVSSEPVEKQWKPGEK